MLNKYRCFLLLFPPACEQASITASESPALFHVPLCPHLLFPLKVIQGLMPYHHDLFACLSLPLDSKCSKPRDCVALTAGVPGTSAQLTLSGYLLKEWING